MFSFSTFFTRCTIPGALSNPDEEKIEMVLILNSHFTKRYLWVNQMYVNSEFLYFERKIY